MSKQSVKTRKRHRTWATRAVEGLGCVAVGAFLCACAAVNYDMRKLDQPVTLNGNPFACAPGARPALKPVDAYSAKVGMSQIIVTLPTDRNGGTSQTTAESRSNEAQVKAFEKIGGDDSMAITNVAIKSDSFGFNFAFVAVAWGANLNATGVAQKIDRAPSLGKETAR
jgi:hypothetical protein